MVRYKVILIYDGTEYFGFQRQSEESVTRTIQGEVEQTLRKIGWDGQTLLAAGRTDAGVHASGQVVAFDLEWRHSEEKLLAALNYYLPTDIAARSVQPVDTEFHPRFDAESRIYQYRIFYQSVRDPLRERFAWRVWPELDSNLINEAAEVLLGSHDFKKIGKPMKPGGSTVRNVFNSQWISQGCCGIYEIEANAFLYHMVRRIVRILVAIGHGKSNRDELISELNGKTVEIVQGIAPAHGLSLVEVVYP
jgi:tRNA pseudouridine38-40 synthase